MHRNARKYLLGNNVPQLYRYVNEYYLRYHLRTETKQKKGERETLKMY